MFRTRLTVAACAAALLATPALAQETPPADTTPATPTNPATPPVEPTVTETPEAPAVAGDATAAAARDGDVVAVLRARGDFSTFVGGLDATGLTEVVANDPDITLLAPPDSAFEALPAGELERLMRPENVDDLRQLLLFHIINADVRSEQVLNRRGGVQTGSGAEVMIDGGGGTIRVGGATVTEADVRGSNGAVFVLDRVLSPAGRDAADAGDGAAEAVPPPPMPEQPTEVPAQDAPTAPPAPATPPVQTPDVGDAEETPPEG